MTPPMIKDRTEYYRLRHLKAMQDPTYRERKRKYANDYNAKHPGRNTPAKSRRYYLKRKEKASIYNKDRYRKFTPDERQARRELYKEWCKKNPDKKRASWRRWYWGNLERSRACYRRIDQRRRDKKLLALVFSVQWPYSHNESGELSAV